MAQWKSKGSVGLFVGGGARDAVLLMSTLITPITAQSVVTQLKSGISTGEVCVLYEALRRLGHVGDVLDKG